jgi:hypothetical protein
VCVCHRERERETPRAPSISAQQCTGGHALGPARRKPSCHRKVRGMCLLCARVCVRVRLCVRETGSVCPSLCLCACERKGEKQLCVCMYVYMCVCVCMFLCVCACLCDARVLSTDDVLALVNPKRLYVNVPDAINLRSHRWSRCVAPAQHTNSARARERETERDRERGMHM